MIPPADRQTLTHCVLKVELDKPVSLLLRKESWLQGWPMGVRVEKRWRKRRLICNGSDTSSKFARPRKCADFRHGVESRETI
ncbi:MAG: hypothetical protein HON48_02535 [Desulfobacula sp.]|nr:hypothetical protein [Desulfobacula sp.]